jgi:PAS domain S-box-containing protein
MIEVNSGTNTSGPRFSIPIALLFVVCFIPLDAATRFIESPAGVVPWYPPAALIVTLLTGFGLRYVPVVFVTVAFSNYVVWQMQPGPFGLGPGILSATGVAAYAGVAAWLRYGVRINTSLTHLRDAAWFAATVAAGASVSSAGYSMYLMASGQLDGSAFVTTFRDFALGDIVGVCTLAPVLLSIVIPWWQRRIAGEDTTGELEREQDVVVDLAVSWRGAFEALAWLGLLLLTLGFAHGTESTLVGNRLYLTFIPLIWASLRLGIRGGAIATLAIACATVSMYVYYGYQPNLPEIQLYLLALSLTGSSLGAAVAEHKNAHAMWRRYEFIANAPGDLMALVNRRYRHEAVNDAFCRAHGTPREGVIGLPIAEVWGADAFEFTIRDYLDRCFEGRTEVTEGWYSCRSLGRRYFRMVYNPYSETGSHVNHAVMVAHDATEQIEADRAHQKTENLYRRAIAASEAVPYVRDYSHGRDEFLFMGPEIERLTGYTVEEMTPALWESLQLEALMYGEMKGLDYAEAVRRTRAGEFKYWRSDNRLRAKDGTERWVTDASVEIQDDEGCVVGCIGILSDITERKKADSDLRTSEERLELALCGADLGLWDWDMRNDVLTVNDRFASMLGYEPNELISAGYVWRSLIHAEDYPSARELMRRHLDGEDTLFEAEYRVRTKSGGYKWILNRGRVFDRDPDGRPIRALGTHLDTTHRHTVEEERRKLEAQIQHAQKLESLGILAGGIAHDFNNLLVGILGNADLALLDQKGASSSQEYLEAIVTSAQRAAELCRQMLAYSGKGRFDVQPIVLNEVVREMAHLLSVSVSKRVSIRYDFAPELPTIEADVTQLRQVIMNLITNASEAIGDDDGVIAIRTTVQTYDESVLMEDFLGDELKPGRYVVLEIVDTGCGMDEDTLARLFDPFFTTKFAGRGLGMAAALGIIRGHGGVINVQSKVGTGTHFTVLLPASDQSPAVPTGQGEYDESWQGSGTVLVIDDEPQVLDLVRKLLVRAGFTPLLASNGHEALEIFEQRSDSIRLVLLDMTMPRMGGPEALRLVRRIRSDVPVVLTSGYSEEDAREQFGAEGPAIFLQKPYRAQALYEVLRRVLEQ